MTFIQIPVGLKATNIQGYSDDQDSVKDKFHSHGKAFLKELAKALGLSTQQFDISSNRGGPAVSGEVTLHADSVYISLSESCTSRGVGMLYRSCKGRKDYSGGTNNWILMRDFAHCEQQERALETMRSLVSRHAQAVAA